MGAVDFDASAWVERERNRLAANPANPAKVEAGEADQTLATLASPPHSPVVATWRDGLASLDPDKPRNGIAPDRWRRMLLDGDAFLTDWGTQAAALGWTDLDLFGCSPGFARRLDRDGLLIGLAGRIVLAMTADAATIDARAGKVTRYYRGDRPGAVLWWQA